MSRKRTRNPFERGGGRYLDPLVVHYRHCCMLLLACQYAYYHHGETILADAEYDRFNDLVLAFERENPEIRHPRTPTRSIGSDRQSDYPPGVVAWVNDAADEGTLDRIDHAAWTERFETLPIRDAGYRLDLT